MNELIYGYDPTSNLYIVGEKTEWGTIEMPIASFSTPKQAELFIERTNLWCSDTRVQNNHGAVRRMK